jgi:penicillin-binding protein 2
LKFLKDGEKMRYNFKIRATAFVLAIIFVVSFFLADLFRIQVVLRDEYASKKFSLSSVETPVSALRGEILDCNGQALVYNVKSNTIYIDASYFPKAKDQSKRNEIVLSLIKLLDEYEVPYNSSLPIELVEGSLVFVENSDSDKAYLYGKDYLNLNDYATEQNVYDALVEYYELGDLSTEEVLKIAGLYFRMTRADFSTINPFTVATDVPDEVVLILKEQSRFYEGVEIRVDTSRAYYDGTIAPHIVGFYDYINADEYKYRTEEYKQLLANTELTEED